MIIFVTGAAGFYGNTLVRRLVDAGKQVRAMVHDLDKAQQRLADVIDRIELVEGDVRDREKMPELMRGATTVVHLVAIPIEKGDATYETINTVGAINVIDAAIDVGVERFINMSQNGAYSSSFSRFLRSKGKAQEYLVQSPLNWTTLRPSMTFGPQDEVFNALAQLVRLIPLVYPLIGGGKTEFHPVSVYDVIEAVMRCIDDESGQTSHKEYKLGGPEMLTLGDIERRILDAMDEQRALIPVPISLLMPVAWLTHHLMVDPPVSTTLLNLMRVPNVV
ncbi:MAG: NAD(P)H-binding protein, partial [Burkholderiales bacterium]|nr:NAD(P)H-binding protein [Anaerolineae bacterium]